MEKKVKEPYIVKNARPNFFGKIVVLIICIFGGGAFIFIPFIGTAVYAAVFIAGMYQFCDFRLYSHCKGKCPYCGKEITIISNNLKFSRSLCTFCKSQILLKDDYFWAETNIRKEAYYSELEILRTSKETLEQKEKVLKLGRDYYSWLRDDCILTQFDEISLQNDLSVSASKIYFDSENNNKESNNISTADEIEKLASLKEKGILTEEEFQKKKKEILEV